MQQPRSLPPEAGIDSRGGLAGLDRWVLGPIIVGVVFGAIQTVHTFEMLYYGFLGVALEALLPLVLAVIIAVTGPWLYLKGYGRDERRRMVGWMALVAVLVGLLYAWTLSHQLVLGYIFPHADFVMTTNLIAGSLLGLVVASYDISSRRRRREVEAERETVTQQRGRLSVLNRVLRHNLRNDLNAIDGYAEVLAEGTADRDEYLARIRGLTADLQSIGEKARYIEQVVATNRERRPTPLSAVVEQTVDTVRASSPDCTIVVETDADATVDESVLEPVLRELLENACRHNEAGSPEIRIETSVEASGDRPVTIRVADDGPGIPEHELAPLREGAETPLEHGSGLGLWLVEWGAKTLGGRVTFEANEPRGTLATLRLPRAG